MQKSCNKSVIRISASGIFYTTKSRKFKEQSTDQNAKMIESKFDLSPESFPQTENSAINIIKSNKETLVVREMCPIRPNSPITRKQNSFIKIK